MGDRLPEVEPLLGKEGTTATVSSRDKCFGPGMFFGSGCFSPKRTPTGGAVAGTKSVGDDDEAKYQPRRRASLQTISLLMIADVVGVGVLSLSEAVAQLGWGLGIFMLITMYPLNVYTGILQWKARNVWPSSVTYTGLVKNAFGKERSSWFHVVWFVYIFCFLGDYLLSAGKTLGMLFYDLRICLPVWSAIAAIGFILPLHQLRTLSSLSEVVLVNVFTITVALLITLGYLWSTGRPPLNDVASFEMKWQTVGRTYLVDPELSFFVFFEATSTMLFAYSGQFLYVEMMAEMVAPEKFPKVFIITGPYQVGVYAMVAFTGYAYLGADVSGFITDVLPFGTMYRASAGCLFIHMIITYTVKGTVIARAVHYMWDKEKINDKGTIK